LLLADESEAGPSWSDDHIVEALGISRRTVERTREKWVESGLEAALNHKRTPRPQSKRLDGEAEARLVQLACSEAPDGRERWTMQMLADKLVELEIVETVSDETVRTTLKKMNSNPG
jgi:transposase